jgi:hypothetical protein
MSLTKDSWSTGFIPSIAAYIAATRIASCVAAPALPRLNISELYLLVWRNVLNVELGLKTILPVIQLSSFQRDWNWRIQKRILCLSFVHLKCHVTAQVLLE